MHANEPFRAPTWAVLLHTRNLAADDALVLAIPRLEPDEQAQAIDILFQRDHDAALGQLVALYGTADEHLRQQLRDHADALSAGARICMTDERLEARQSAIELIRASRSGRLAYLLAEGLRHPCRKTVQLAAEALAELTDHLAGGPESASARVSQARTAQTYLAAALRTALASWPLHLRPEVIQAVARMAAPLEDAILASADDPRSNVARALINVLAGSQDARLAGLCLRALRSQSLRVAAANLLVEVRTENFRTALVDDAWLLADDDVRRSCSRVREFACLRDEADVLAEANAGRARAAVRLIATFGGRHHSRVQVLRNLCVGTSAEAARAALWALIDDRSDEATEVLNGLSARSSVPLREVIRLELRRRTYGTFAARGVRAAASEMNISERTDMQSAFEPYWSAFDTLPETDRISIGKAVLEGVPDFAAQLRAKWAEGADADRLRFLMLVQALGLAASFESEIYAAASDQGSHIRSLSAALLATLDTATSRRLLRSALNDTDERVQANAIESLENLGASAETALMLDKLNAPASRVRANAVKVLVNLGMREGAHALFEMLASDAAPDRLSALWVVERMRLQNLFTRIETMVEGDPDTRVRARARRLLHVFGGLRQTSMPRAKEVRI